MATHAPILSPPVLRPMPPRASVIHRQPALFQRFPRLVGQIPWQPLPGSQGLSPVEPLPALEGDVWVKRDDLSNRLYGGNKSRKLEFILPDLLHQGKTGLVTFGAIGTNHGVATAAFCQQLGVDCTVLLFRQPVTDTVRQNLKLMHKFGARLVYGGSLLATALRFYTLERIRQPGAYFLFAGGSNVLGCLAYVSAALELAEQIAQGDLPEPAEIIVPAGSNATLAGLTLGCALAGLNTRVIGIRVAPSHVGPFQACTGESAHQLMRDTWQYLTRRLANLKLTPLPPIRLNDQYYGTGYGQATAAGRAALSLARHRCGLTLEPTYTAKAFAAVRDAGIRHGGPVLYWHTYNSVDQSPHLSQVTSDDLPPPLNRFAAPESEPLFLKPDNHNKRTIP